MAEPGIEWFRKSAMWYSSRSTPGGGTIYGGPDGAPAPFDYDAFHENESFFGDPDECFRKIERMYEALHPTDITFLFKM